uniref:Uncharacterized protein n=1 Tax=Dunaliella tertiolecta TaxID=3047 RepID=A0A7S3VNA7_DUNTE
MQQAIVLMADRVDVTQLEVLVEGHDGQLPKLDMYYMLRTAARYTTSIRVKPRAEHAQPLWLLRPVMDLVKDPKVKSHIHKVMFSLQFAARQAMGTPTGPHAAFKEFLVDAATANMSGTPPLRNDYVPEQLPRKTADYIGQVAGYLEAMLRSLNNLDERFHHSYFLYLLTSPDTFVTVEVYIVPLVALIAALMVKVRSPI